VQTKQNGGDKKPSAPSFKHLPSLNIIFLKGKITMAVYGAKTTTQWHVRMNITATSSHRNVICQPLTIALI